MAPIVKSFDQKCRPWVMSVRLLAVCCFICGTPAISAPRVLLRKTSHKGVRQPVQQVSKKLSPELGIKKSSDRGHLPVVIRKAGLNGPPGLGKSGRDPFQLWSINRRPQARPASPYLVRARSAYLGPRSANFSSKPERGRSFGDIASDGEVRASSRDLLCSADLFQWGCGPFAVGSARRAISAPSVLPSSPLNSSASRSLAGRAAGYEWYGTLPFNLEQR
jgi:hypothetical protein